MVLVPEPTSPRLTPLKVREPAVNFLKQSTRPQAVQMRRNVNDWYERFPQSDAKFRKNLLSRKNHEHNGALNELHLHEQLRRMHEDVRYELLMEGEVVRHPRPGHAVGPGPGSVVVRAEGFLLDSTPSYDVQLAAYARAHGLPPPPPLGWWSGDQRQLAAGVAGAEQLQRGRGLVERERPGDRGRRGRRRRPAGSAAGAPGPGRPHCPGLRRRSRGSRRRSPGPARRS
jgi:hypothetical protein